jgi:hypothetical protein
MATNAASVIDLGGPLAPYVGKAVVRGCSCGARCWAMGCSPLSVRCRWGAAWRLGGRLPAWGCGLSGVGFPRGRRLGDTGLPRHGHPDDRRVPDLVRDGAITVPLAIWGIAALLAGAVTGRRSRPGRLTLPPASPPTSAALGWRYVAIERKPMCASVPNN